MNILFISYAFPPISSPGSMRIFNFAKYLSKQDGYSVDVLHCLNGYSSMIDYNRNWEFGKINTIPVSEVISLNKLTKSNNSRDNVRTPIFKNKKVKALKKLKTLVFPDRNIFWTLNVVRKKPLTNDYDYIISSYPSISNLMLGYYYSKSLGIPLIVDMRDLWTQDLNFNSKSYFRRIIEYKIESAILNKAHIITTVSSFNALELSKQYGNKVQVIYNGFENEKFIKKPSTSANVLSDTQNKNNRLKIAYAGSFYNGERNIDMLMLAIKSLKDKDLINSKNFTFDIYGNNEDYIIKLVSKYNLNDLVCLKGFVSQDILFEKLTTYNLLLVVTRDQLISKGELTTKVFEYIALGNPILCLSKPDFEIVSVLNGIDHTYFININDKAGIENLLSDFINDESKKTARRDLSLEFSRDAMSEKLRRLLK